MFYFLICIGRWVKLDLFYVPLVYFKHLLATTKCVPHSAKETSHFRAPVLTDSTRRISYRSHDAEHILQALQQQNKLEVKTRATHGQQAQEMTGLSAREKLSLAKAKAAQPGGFIRTVNSVSEIDISEPSRKLEMIWWPTLYNNMQYGKLTLRLFVQKTSM